MDKGTEYYRRFREEGDEEGLALIIREYRDGLIFYLNSFTGNIRTAEELAEDTFVLLGTKKPRDKGKGAFKTWLYTIGRNLAIDHLRRDRRLFGALSVEEAEVLCSEEDDLEKSFFQQEQMILLHKVLRKLKPEHRQILWLIYFEGFSAKEAAVILKRSTHSVESLTYRAKKALKAQLETEGFHYEDL